MMYSYKSIPNIDSKIDAILNDTTPATAWAVALACILMTAAALLGLVVVMAKGLL